MKKPRQPPQTIVRPDLVAIARDEVKRWHNLPPGLVIAILFAYVHRVTTGETYEETSFHNKHVPDYQI